MEIMMGPRVLAGVYITMVVQALCLIYLSTVSRFERPVREYLGVAGVALLLLCQPLLLLNMKVVNLGMASVQEFPYGITDDSP